LLLVVQPYYRGHYEVVRPNDPIALNWRPPECRAESIQACLNCLVQRLSMDCADFGERGSGGDRRDDYTSIDQAVSLRQVRTSWKLR
uniref:Uncharacterized protein n=1 Tax=Parascaris equorum TaxID=6256 RepID=A0A914SAI2_PAREQ